MGHGADTEDFGDADFKDEALPSEEERQSWLAKQAVVGMGHLATPWERGEPTFDQQVKAARRGGQERKMTKLAIVQPSSLPSIEGLEAVLLDGNLAKLNAEQRVSYYKRVCESVGLNPLTQPFEYLSLSGKTVLYARRACTDQLRQIHKVSVTIVAREKVDGIYVVTARAQTPDGRTDESIGAVPLDNLKGENLSNALMKAETKAKRRVTLAICGLSMMDELEVESIPQARTKPGKPARTLDDVAHYGHQAERAEDGPAGPAGGGEIEGEIVDTTEWQPPLFGLTPPTLPCPTFGPRATKALQGKRWDVHAGAWLVQQWWEGEDVRGDFSRVIDNADEAKAMNAWATHIVELRKRRHAHDEKQKTEAEARLQASSEETST
jgi:hypothetical protein